jgi:DNA-binding transcriptional LysR family regulator
MGFLAHFHGANPGCEITLVEGVPARLSELLLQGELDLAVMAQPSRSTSGLRYCGSIANGSASPSRPVTAWSSRTAFRSLMSPETYLRRINCEYRDYLAERLREQGLATRVGFQSEREDWIQMMVAAGFGVCFLPSFRLPSLGSAPSRSANRKSFAWSHWSGWPAGGFRPRCWPSPARSEHTTGRAVRTADCS